MTELFAITAATNSVNLNNKRQAEVAFTVSNAENRPIRGRAHILPEGEAAAKWFSLAGESEQDFAVAGTQQYTVKIVVPPDAPAGDYFFRLNMVGVENPDEDFAEGPSVSFTVPEPEVKKKSFPWWILLVILAVVIIGGVAAFLLTRGQPELAVTLEVSANPVIAGRDMTYTIQVNNTGRKSAKNVVVKDTLPSGVTFVSASNESCALGEAGEILSCTLADGLGGNDTAEIMLNVSVDGSVRGTMTNTVLLDTTDPTVTPEPTTEAEPEETAEADSAEAGPIQAVIASEVVGQVSLAVAMTGPASAAADEEIVYKVEVSNNGPSHAGGVIITFPRPAGVLGATGISQKGNCGETEDSLRCELGQVQAGATLPVTITILPGPELVGTLNSIVSVTDQDGSNISSEAVSTQVEPATGLAVAVNTSGSQALIGEPFVYNVRIWNSSPVAANNVEMRYTVPEGWEFINTDPECPQQIFAGTITVICNFGDFPADPDDVRTVNIALVATAEGTTTNNFDISSANLPDEQVALETRVAKAFSAVGVRLDGKNDWVELDDFNVPETFTIEMWLNPEASRDGQAFIGKHLAGGENVFVLGYYSNGINLTLRDQSYSAGEKTTELYHLAVVVEKRTLSQSFVTVYQNGEVFWDQEFAAVMGTDMSGLGWVLGQDWDAATRTDFYDGAIAELRFWDHARTQDQINALMDERLVGDEAGLIAYLPLTEQSGTTAADLTGNGHDGTLKDGAVWVDASPPPDFGSAIELDGVDDYVFLPDADTYDFVRDQNFTVEFWVKPEATQPDIGNSDNDMVEKWSGAGGYPFVLRYINRSNTVSNGQVIFARYDGSNNPSVVSTTRINDGEYHHIAAVKNGNSLMLYIDGVLQGTSTDTTTGSTTNTSGLNIGRRGSNINHFAGSIDELRIWNIARSQDQIQTTMNQPLRGNEAGLVAYWRFDVVVSNVVYDATGNGNDGSLISFTILIPNFDIIPVFPTPIFPGFGFGN